jgi:hypothetical protein
MADLLLQQVPWIESLITITGLTASAREAGSPEWCGILRDSSPGIRLLRASVYSVNVTGKPAGVTQQQQRRLLEYHTQVSPCELVQLSSR